MVRFAFAEGVLYGRLRLEEFNDGAEVGWSVSGTDEERWRSKKKRMPTHQLPQPPELC